MPFPIVLGIPRDTNLEVVEQMRRDIVSLLAKKMKVPTNWLRPFFLHDLLDDPREEGEGATTICIILLTGMFSGKLSKKKRSLPRKVVKALAKLVWNALDGKYEVECFVGPLNPEWKYLIKASNDK